MRPVEVTWNLGNDAWGRPVSLCRKVHYSKGELYEIRVSASNQLDSTQLVYSLTAENLSALAEAVAASK